MQEKDASVKEFVVKNANFSESEQNTVYNDEANDEEK